MADESSSEEIITTTDDGTNTVVTDETFTDTVTTSTTPDVAPPAAPEPAQPPGAPLAQEFPPSAPVEPTAPDAGTTETVVEGDVVVEADEPGPELTSTIEGVDVEDAPHAAVDDSVGQAETAAYNDAVATDDPNAPTGEELTTDVDGTIVTQGDMPASGVWPGQEGDYAPSAEAQAQHEEGASNKPTE